MALPSDQANLIGVHVYPIADLALAATVTSAANVNSTVFNTGAPATVYVSSKLSSGSGTIKVSIADVPADINYGAPTATLSCSGTSVQSLHFDTSASQLNVGLQQSSGASATWSELAVLVLYELQFGEDWPSVRHGVNAVMNTSIGDGGGLVPNAIA
jgi:hypothetical protein